MRAAALRFYRVGEQGEKLAEDLVVLGTRFGGIPTVDLNVVQFFQAEIF